MVALTVWQLRWGYFLSAMFALALPVFMPGWRKAWIAWPIFLIALWPIAQEWDAVLYPDKKTEHRRELERAEAVALRNIVDGKSGENGGPFLAPWWLSPSIAYWSRQPGVAGSSHESLPGTVDSARFFLSKSEEEGLVILQARGVRWILADDALRVIGNSAALLGVPPPESCMAQTLAPRGALGPGDSMMIGKVITSGMLPPTARENSFFKVWRIDEPGKQRRQQNDELVP
jgi:hypothetical protein